MSSELYVVHYIIINRTSDLKQTQSEWKTHIWQDFIMPLNAHLQVLEINFKCKRIL